MLLQIDVLQVFTDILLQIADRDYFGSWTVRTLYCGESIPTILVSSSNTITLRFRSDNIENRRGFQVVYAAGTGEKCYYFTAS